MAAALPAEPARAGVSVAEGAIWSYAHLMNPVWWPLLVRTGVVQPVLDPDDGLPTWDDDGADIMDANTTCTCSATPRRAY